MREENYLQSKNNHIPVSDYHYNFYDIKRIDDATSTT